MRLLLRAAAVVAVLVCAVSVVRSNRPDHQTIATPIPEATTSTSTTTTTTTTTTEPPPVQVIEAPPAPMPATAPPTDRETFLACVRQREGGGNYSINTGNGYFGTYQFLQSTWDTTAEHAGRPDLIGVHASDASPADQDAMARALYEWQGPAPWAGGNYPCPN